MKLHTLFLVLSMAGAFTVSGCDGNGTDDSGVDDNNGDADGDCDECENQSDIGLCEVGYEECMDSVPNEAECSVGALLLCEVI
jgi:hypothetical protein